MKQTFVKKQPFLRGRQGMKQKEFCYTCHDENKFQKYNPHKQLDENKQIIEVRCLYCHFEVPDVKKSTHEDIKLIGDFVMVCDRCHNKASEKSLHASHLRVPSGKVFASIKQVEIKFGIVLPMDKNGKITCATCHNPHEKGVIPKDREGAKGSDSLHRQRILDNICMQCHQM
jgi:ubiquitin